MSRAIAIAHPNIALVKYWGKADIPLNLPAVPSVSMTVRPFQTRTELVWGAERDSVQLNGQVACERDATRVRAFLDIVDPDRPPVAVVSDNNFPTRAGLASSSSGFAALALAAVQASGQDLDLPAISALARRGSGSACRSLFGGFVQWNSTHAEPLAPADHWPELKMLVAVVSRAEKPIGSTEGMVLSRDTSAYYEQWVRTAPADVQRARHAIAARDFHALGAVMEASTFKMHAVMHTSVPPLLYWQPQTLAVLHRVRELSTAYVTMDAGPNVKVLTRAEDVDDVTQALAEVCPDIIALDAGPGAYLVDA